MKKNLAKRIILGLLTGAVLMSSSVAWANVAAGPGAGQESVCVAPQVGSGDNVGLGANASSQYGVAVGSGAVAGNLEAGYVNTETGCVALGAKSLVTGSFGVALGFGSVANQGSVVSVGSGGTDVTNGVYGVPETRRIINVTAGTGDTDAVNVKQLRDAFKDVDAITYENYQGTEYDKYAVSVKTLKNVLTSVQATNDATYVEKVTTDDVTETKLSDNFVVTDTAIDNSNSTTTTVTINASDANNPIVMNNEGITVGTNSTRMDGTGFYVWKDGDHTPENAKAFMNNEGVIKGAGGAFMVNASGNVTAKEVTATKLYIDKGNGITIDVENELGKKADTSYVDSELAKKADKTETNTKLAALEQADQDLKTQIDNIGGGAIAGLNQRLEKTNAKINKVGAGAAALAALHPLDYDPDDKLTFSAGMGNYAGENAAALGAFYRPNEKFMLSLGGTMGNGENMVNLGLSIGLDKASGFAKMSKRELIQEVNAVKAENEAMKDQLANADERIAKLEALVAQLVAK